MSTLANRKIADLHAALEQALRDLRTLRAAVQTPLVHDELAAAAIARVRAALKECN